MTTALTKLLSDWRQGDLTARDRVIDVVYPELRAIASRQLAAERRNHTLQPTALVNEAYMRLTGVERVDWRSSSHFVRIVARLMREILVDHARRRGAVKRDGGEQVTLTGVDVPDNGSDIDVERLDGALARLEQLDADKGRIVELRYFAGLTIDETAQALEMSPATVKRHWQAARVWLHEALKDPG
ncbi:sigma-70 family RNA polymerase sigma factor [Steroidobacter sp.]|uniref:sigma-70 family RNA polymerase sigma factor n=1 Tax=Steroidobacter sp. TaxID=1978227 RepID=UPI001A3887D5|nr:sigma-70 family RNA polymerase sigma factor [Steroidobacter sp.]MBL8268181.1 sigma-70 family RNA polymerase sigma factor [Steroidobacter sp.]